MTTKKYIQNLLRESLMEHVSASDDQIRTARVCPYCGNEPEFVDSKVIYGKSYGMVYLCKPCKAWVGTHDGSRKALGRLADHDLREAKKRAHFYFDQLWRRAVNQGRSKTQARNAAYVWLSKQMGLPVEHTHIGMFDVDQCNQVVDICLPYCTPKK